jgi:hypothetical protein
LFAKFERLLDFANAHVRTPNEAEVRGCSLDSSSDSDNQCIKTTRRLVKTVILGNLTGTLGALADRAKQDLAT